mmetsp:Transcript_49044/g.160422  ORF Transcript_49044/g.160422 Transcript_49044/m.160422 type:complete len:335 (+) Transcript_49044:338-1342(+)
MGVALLVRPDRRRPPPLARRPAAFWLRRRPLHFPLQRAAFVCAARREPCRTVAARLLLLLRRTLQAQQLLPRPPLLLRLAVRGAAPHRLPAGHPIAPAARVSGSRRTLHCRARRVGPQPRPARRGGGRGRQRHGRGRRLPRPPPPLRHRPHPAAQQRRRLLRADGVPPRGLRPSRGARACRKLASLCQRGRLCRVSHLARRCSGRRRRRGDLLGRGWLRRGGGRGGADVDHVCRRRRLERPHLCPARRRGAARGGRRGGVCCRRPALGRRSLGRQWRKWLREPGVRAESGAGTAQRRVCTRLRGPHPRHAELGRLDHVLELARGGRLEPPPPPH